MKRIFLAVCVMAMTAFAVPAWSDSLITPWSGAIYTNPTRALPNSNPGTEQAFLADILNLPINDPSIQWIEPTLFKDWGNPSLNEPITFLWLYAVVKSDGQNDGWYAYENDGNDFLTVGPYRYNISHVDFYGDGTGTQVPEPATMLLLGSGLIGLVGYGRKKLLKK